MSVPLFDPAGPLRPLRDELRAAVGRVLDREQYILGVEVEAFEREFAAYIGAREAVGVANGTEAITIGLRALGVGPGDDVVVPSFSFYASAEAIPVTGARPVFCDVDPDTANVTLETITAVRTSSTRAVVAVDLFGNPAPVQQIREETGLVVVEDAAQAAGAAANGRRTGSLGTIATFSFFPSKNLACFGDGGAIATDEDRLAENARMLRFHGSKNKVTFEEVGYNSRLDELQAAVLRVMLPHLDAWAEGRRAAARAYEQAGLGELVALPLAAPGAEPAWHLYVVRHPEPDGLIADLDTAGVQARGYYRTPVHRQPAMAQWGHGAELPATDELARTNVALPMSPVLSSGQAREVVDAVRRASALQSASTASPPGLAPQR